MRKIQRRGGSTGSGLAASERVFVVLGIPTASAMRTTTKSSDGKALRASPDI
jgi:hypothetical protein